MDLKLSCLLLPVITVACSTAPLDPFGRPYDEANLMKPQPMSNCRAASGMDEPPFLKFGSQPVYPVHSHILARDGLAKVVFRVGKDGTLSVEEYTTPDTVWFANHAAIAMRDWKVTPAMRAGVPVEAQCVIEFQYTIRR